MPIAISFAPSRSKRIAVDVVPANGSYIFSYNNPQGKKYPSTRGIFVDIL